MKGEPLTHFIYVNLSERDRRKLEYMAQERGATLSGVIRKLIRDASQYGDRAANVLQAQAGGQSNASRS